MKLIDYGVSSHTANTVVINSIHIKHILFSLVLTVIRSILKYFIISSCRIGRTRPLEPPTGWHQKWLHASNNSSTHTTCDATSGTFPSLNSTSSCWSMLIQLSHYQVPRHYCYWARRRRSPAFRVASYESFISGWFINKIIMVKYFCYTIFVFTKKKLRTIGFLHCKPLESFSSMIDERSYRLFALLLWITP